MKPPVRTLLSPLQRIRFWYAALLFICAVFLVRLFYLQVIRHEHYQTAALSKQLKEYEIPAERGIIEAYDGDNKVAIVLNETKYTLFADPKFVDDPSEVAESIEQAIGGKADEYQSSIEENSDSRYVILAKKLDKSQKEAIDKLELKGVGTREAVYRTYPQGSLASQVLGFVNDEGVGTYGLEQALNDELDGIPGQLRAITDAQGVPLPANKENTVVEPKSGKGVVLTIDVGMQERLEEFVREGVVSTKALSGSALIIEVETGAIKAMANYPTYNPAEFFKVKDAEVFNNAAVSMPLEVGSIMKVLTAAAALDQGVVSKNTSYYDPGVFVVDDARIVNVEEVRGPGTKSVADILQQSLNTGATWLLMQMGGGEINEKARVTWHDYMTEHYRLGQKTGIEQGFEAAGAIPDPKEGFGLNIKFANTTFGQGMTATPLQMGAALAAVLNDGKYYQPHLVDRIINSDGTETVNEPKVLNGQVVKPEVSRAIIDLMEYAFTNSNHGIERMRSEFMIGGKSGSAQIADPNGGYYDDRYNGTFMGYVGGDKPQYVVISRVSQPKVAGYAGSVAARPIFVKTVLSLIDNFGVKPKASQ